MEANEGPPVRADLVGLPAWANATILAGKLSDRAGPLDLDPQTRLHVGADLGCQRLPGICTSGPGAAACTGIPARVPPNPLFVTPLGIAGHDALR